MDTKVLTLNEFLLARIDDDDLRAERAGHGFDHHPMGAERSAGWTDIDPTDNLNTNGDAAFVAHHSPRRVHEECRVKRQIVAELAADSVALREWATLYATHPDFDQAWRP